VTWNVIYDIAFIVENCPEENGTNVNPKYIREAILKRLTSLADAELYEAVGFCDSYEEEEVKPHIGLDDELWVLKTD
tara:strand:+ start:839 stop:1069 length:231 start_codon:yes stop_codon:yes gene_type:complete